ncbi:MAG: hypothetical protein AAF351_07885 [Pseudomonadota bacterium]
MTAALPAVSIETFEAAQVDPDVFDHEAHVYTAWLYLERWPLDEALRRFCAAIKRLTIALGAESKYNETISWFFMILIHERRQSGAAGCWHNFRHDNDDLVAGAGLLLKRYYRPQTLASELARHTFVLPDRFSETR